jgi:hypothetical protein
MTANNRIGPADHQLTSLDPHGAPVALPIRQAQQRGRGCDVPAPARSVARRASGRRQSAEASSNSRRTSSHRASIRAVFARRVRLRMALVSERSPDAAPTERVVGRRRCADQLPVGGPGCPPMASRRRETWRRCRRASTGAIGPRSIRPASSGSRFDSGRHRAASGLIPRRADGTNGSQGAGRRTQRAPTGEPRHRRFRPAMTAGTGCRHRRCCPVPLRAPRRPRRRRRQRRRPLRA